MNVIWTLSMVAVKCLLRSTI